MLNNIILIPIGSSIHGKLIPQLLKLQDWCRENNSEIKTITGLSHNFARNYLFSTSKDLIDRFINLAPYSQFGLPNDINSPGSIGAWLGLQIWNSYVAKTNVSLIEVLNETDYLKVLNNSGYKP